MSRLSRFKKAPALRLPKKLPTPSKLDEDSDDDDDFITKRKPIKYKDTPKSNKKSPETQREIASQLLSPGEASTSEYFRQPTNDAPPKNVPSSSKVGEKKVVPEHSNDTEEKTTDAPRNKNKTKTKQTKETTSSNSVSPEVTPPVVQEESNDNGSGESEGKIVCPFCWKKLSDKLTGTTHVKACAKNVPIPQIIEAMQLQEKQMQEWEKLGLAFPGFAGVNTNNNGKKTKNGTGTTRTRTGGGGRSRKKTAPVTTGDPEFELAVALSMSLHEELESRQSKENQFIIENGLEKEIDIVEVKKPTAPKDTQKKTISRQAHEISPSVAALTLPPVSRRRGKKVQLNELPLYKVNDDRKKEIICERVSKILDESDKDKDHEFYIRNKIPSDAIGIPKRLIQFQNKESSLWARAQAAQDEPNESFSVLPMPDPSQKLEMTYPVTDESTDELQSTENSFLGTDKESPTEEEKSVAQIFVPAEPAVVNTKEKEKNDLKLPASNVRKTSNTSCSSTGSSIASQSVTAIRKLPRVMQDIVGLLMHKKGCDMTLYGREEKPIKCHSFMLLARCPRMMSDVVEENVGKRFRRVVSLTDYSHKTIKAFLWYVYTGEIDNTYDEKLLDELKDLASTYGMPFTSEEEETKSDATAASFCSVEVQTEVLVTEDTSTMTEDFERNTAETGFDSCEEYKASQELFTTYMEEPQISFLEIKCKSPVKETFQLTEIIENKPDHDDEDEEDVYSDVDLFEDIENEMNKALQSRQSVPNCTADMCTIPVKSHCASPGPGHIDTDVSKPVEGSSSEESFWNELRSPSKSLDNVKKRLRSDSPLVDDSNQLYTGTQAAAILEAHFAGDSDDVQLTTKAIKKQKLDCSGFKQTNGCNENCEMEVDNLNAEYDSVKKWCDDDDALFDISYNVNADHQSGLVTPKSTLMKSRRSVSTPNLSIIEPDNKPNDSPFYNNLQSPDNEVDPFWDACDDSVFANIPDEVLMKAKTPKIRNLNGTNCLRNAPAASKCASQRSLTPISHTRRRLSPRNLSRFEDEESLSTTSTTRKGNKTGRGNGNGKAKSAPKIKLPRKLQSTKNASQFECNSLANDLSQSQDTIKSQPPPQQHPLAESTNSCNSKSPMLNYSLIDTPILKQELKKYGIKPLPRSKAKVLLRHIYKETHK